MPRDVSAAFVAVMQSYRVFRPRLFVEMDFADQPVRAWTGLGDFLWDGKVWKGIGLLGTGARLEERGGVEVEALQLTLNSVPLDTKQLSVPRALYQGRDCDIYLAEMNEGEALAEAPQLLFSGPMDFMVEREGQGSAALTLNVPSELVLLNLARRYYYTPEDQRALSGDPSDTFFDFIPKDTEEIVW